MKSKSLLSLFSILFVVQLAHAQQSIFPVLADTPKWCMVSVNYNGSDPTFVYSDFKLEYQKDTIVDGKNYTKLMRGYNNFNFSALIRNEGKKSFIKRVIPNQTTFSFANESPLYDFTMASTNDSIVVHSFPPYLANRDFFVVAKFNASDSILMNGIKRKRIKVTYTSINIPSQTKISGEWIEGYGDLKNPFYDCLSCSDTWTRTMALDIKGQRVYQDSTIANGCTPKRVGVYDPLQTHISVYPNPVVHQLNINLSKVDNLLDAEVVVHDLVGKAVFRERVQTFDTPLSIDLSYLNAGMYILSLQTQNQKLFSKKIIKSN